MFYQIGMVGGGPILVVNWEARSRIEPPIWTLQTTVRGFLRTGDADPFKVLKRWEGPCVASTYFVAVCHCGKYEEFGPALNTTALEARGGIEPPIKVLQTFALPLGDRASL